MADCANEALVHEILGRIADKWTLIVLDELEDGPHRFSVLKRKIPGISQKMLTQTLRTMECDGLIDRKVYPVIPPRVEYRLTKIGNSLGEAVCSIWHWAERHGSSVQKARTRFARSRDLSAPLL